MTAASQGEIAMEDAAKTLWRQYKRTPEYKSGRKYSISATHPLVRQGEEQGLNDVILSFAKALEQGLDMRTQLSLRSEGDWINNWQQMHSELFKYVYKRTGELRKKGHDVRFGDPGDEEKHHIPSGGAEVYNALYAHANSLVGTLGFVDTRNIDEVCRYLARFHYGFIRIHPFFDGNGRIARVVTDQLSVALGYIPIIAGFPRTNTEKKRVYHAAIQACANDPGYTDLANWIKLQMTEKLASLA